MVSISYSFLDEQMNQNDQTFLNNLDYALLSYAKKPE